MLSIPYLHLCTENLTPFLSLLPSKGHSGLSHLLAQPGIVFSWGFKTEGIEIIMPANGQPGRWRGWWEGVVDLVPEKNGGSRDFSLGSLFQRGVPRPFPEATSSTLKLVGAAREDALRVSIEPDTTGMVIMDGSEREVKEWDLLNERLQRKDIKFSWDGENTFVYREFTSWYAGTDNSTYIAYTTYRPAPYRHLPTSHGRSIHNNDPQQPGHHARSYLL